MTEHESVACSHTRTESLSPAFIFSLSSFGGICSTEDRACVVQASVNRLKDVGILCQTREQENVTS